MVMLMMFVLSAFAQIDETHENALGKNSLVDLAGVGRGTWRSEINRHGTVYPRTR
jgi:hypothetical protein